MPSRQEHNKQSIRDAVTFTKLGVLATCPCWWKVATKLRRYLPRRSFSWLVGISVDVLVAQKATTSWKFFMWFGERNRYCKYLMVTVSGICCIFFRSGLQTTNQQKFEAEPKIYPCPPKYFAQSTLDPLSMVWNNGWSICIFEVRLQAHPPYNSPIISHLGRNSFVMSGKVTQGGWIDGVLLS